MRTKDTKKQTVLFDIDGTLADVEHRRVFLKSPKPDWKAFNERMGDDTTKLAIADLYRALWDSGKYELIILTGRGEEHRKITEQWLVWNNIPFNRLIMRSAKDFRADHIIKEEMLNLLLSEEKNISFVVDDRQQVVDMWRRNGIVCLQCDVGDF